LVVEHPGARLVGAISRRLPARRWQVAHWLGKVLVPKRPFVGRFHDGRIEVHPGEVASMLAFVHGFYEREVTIWCLERIRKAPPGLLVDVGANFGYYPLLFGLRSGGRTESLAFEPDPSNFAWLTRNVRLNPRLRITPVAAAVGGEDGKTVTFATAKEGHNLWARVGDGEAGGHSGERVPVTVRTLDSYLDRAGVGDVPLVMIDVEGYEAEVLRGMADGIARRRYGTVLLEFHPWAFPSPEAVLAGIADDFARAGYRGYRFRHHASPHLDKDPRYFDLAYDPAILGPLSSGNLSGWEHYLFTCHDDASDVVD
jgi:FkbM family methyltransferase